MSRVLACTSLSFAFVSSLALGGAACKAKPSAKACKEAIENIRTISSQSMSDVGADPQAAIRSCRANSSKKSVECMRIAKTEEELRKCEGAEGDEYFKEAQDVHKGTKTEDAAKEDAAAAAAVPASEDASTGAAAIEPSTGTGDAGTAAVEGEPANTEPANAEPAKAEPAKAQPAKAQPAKAQPAKAQPAKAQPAAKAPSPEPKAAAEKAAAPE